MGRNVLHHVKREAGLSGRGNIQGNMSGENIYVQGKCPRPIAEWEGNAFYVLISARLIWVCFSGVASNFRQRYVSSIPCLP